VAREQLAVEVEDPEERVVQVQLEVAVRLDGSLEPADDEADGAVAARRVELDVHRLHHQALPGVQHVEDQAITL
jgi:hypothetical protein